jgi:hypothetical protein
MGGSEGRQKRRMEGEIRRLSSLSGRHIAKLQVLFRAQFCKNRRTKKPLSEHGRTSDIPKPNVAGHITHIPSYSILTLLTLSRYR